ncbi:MAG: hypothetical protein LBR12_05715, partial [Opitutaceae bacterium]|nr:hypothetical protein [Opitutaceae bacterium]
MHSQNLRDATASSFNTPAPFHPATALHHNANKLPRLLASLPLALAPVLLTAQSSPPQQPAADDDAVVLAAVTVEGADVDKSVLPTRPNANFYGFEELIQNSPRSIFQVSKAQLEADNFDNFGDLARYSPSVGRGTVSSFSTFSKIRGGSGDTTRNGVLLIPAAVRPFNNNYWEAVDIVAGIPSVIQGSTTRTAGVVNYVTKKPTFDKDKTDITVSLGRLGKDNDTTYPQVTVQLDYNKVLGDDLAFRLSLQRTDADQYWGNARSNFYDLYAATTWKPLKNLTIETNYNYTNVYDSPKPTGINRLDQNLIDNWQYRSGYGTLQTTGYVVGSDVYTSAAAAAAVHGGSAADYKSSTLFGLRSPGNDGKWTVGSSPSSLTSAQFTDGWNFHGAFTLTGNLPVSDETVLVPINGSQTQWSDTAYTESQEHILQNIATLRINEHFTLKNNSLYQYSHSYVHDSDGYESYMINKMITSRFELTSDFEFGKSNAWLKKLGLRHQSNSGFELRYLYNYCDG